MLPFFSELKDYLFNNKGSSKEPLESEPDNCQEVHIFCPICDGEALIVGQIRNNPKNHKKEVIVEDFSCKHCDTVLTNEKEFKAEKITQPLCVKNINGKYVVEGHEKAKIILGDAFTLSRSSIKKESLHAQVVENHTLLQNLLSKVAIRKKLFSQYF